MDDDDEYQYSWTPLSIKFGVFCTGKTNPSCTKNVFWLHHASWNSLDEVAVSFPCNMWRFYGALDLAREGIKTWKWQLPWRAIK